MISNHIRFQFFNFSELKQIMGRPGGGVAKDVGGKDKEG